MRNLKVPDNYDLWQIHEHEMEKEIEKLPTCDYCGEHIQDEYCYEIGNNIVCEDCLNDEFRIWVDEI